MSTLETTPRIVNTGTFAYLAGCIETAYPGNISATYVLMENLPRGPHRPGDTIYIDERPYSLVILGANERVGILLGDSVKGAKPWRGFSAEERVNLVGDAHPDYSLELLTSLARQCF